MVPRHLHAVAALNEMSSESIWASECLPVGSFPHHPHHISHIHSYCGSVTQSCPTLCDPMDFSMPRLLILHYLLEFAQTQAR